MSREFTQALTDLNTRLQKATISKDPKAFASLLHDSWLTLDAAGGITEKNAEVEALAKAQVDIDYELKDLTVRNFGKNIAVVIGTTVTRGTAMKRKLDREYRFMQVWATPSAVAAPEDTNWLMLACVNLDPQSFPSAE